MGKAAEIARRYAELYSDGTPEHYGSERILELFAPDVDLVVFPTHFQPSGQSGNRETFREGLVSNSKFLRDRKIEINEIVEEGAVATWTGTYTATIGVDGLDSPRGSRIRLQLAVVIEVRNDMIVRYHEYPIFSRSDMNTRLNLCIKKLKRLIGLLR